MYTDRMESPSFSSLIWSEWKYSDIRKKQSPPYCDNLYLTYQIDEDSLIVEHWMIFNWLESKYRNDFTIQKFVEAPFVTYNTKQPFNNFSYPTFYLVSVRIESLKKSFEET